MKHKLPAASRPGSPRRGAVDPALVDELIWSYVCWREARDAVWAAYETWSDSTGPDDHYGFEGYWASLHREEQAATVYARCVTRVGGQARDVDRQPAGRHT